MLAAVPEIDVMDSTWLAAPPHAVAPVIADPANWHRWWPQLRLEVEELRGPKGVRWQVPAVDGAPGLSGTAEVWLEASCDGVVAHFFLRLDAAPATPLARGQGQRIARAARVATKRAFWALGDELDAGRAARLCVPRATV